MSNEEKSPILFMSESATGRTINRIAQDMYRVSMKNVFREVFIKKLSVLRRILWAEL